jgi:glyoxylase-like metal-dependent hydrolase (beta-lactamase superfamily II)
MKQITMDMKTLQEILAQGQPVTVLDIRPADERAEWAIPGSIHIDAYDALKANDPNVLASLVLPGDRPVVTVCGAGATSLVAAQQLRARGLQALSLEGGMRAWSLAWNRAEVPLANSSATVIQVRRTGKGCLSYLIGASGTAAVVDPALEPEIYLDMAHHYGWTITHILETHIHADHLSRALALASQSGASLYLPDQDRVAYPFTAIQDGDELEIGAARLKAIHTPGHTGESTCYLLDGQALFTGDTLFLSGVGRPDLEATADEAARRARWLYRSLQRLLALPPETLVLPGHTSQPVAFDGQAIGASLAEVRRQTEFLQVPEETFVELLLARIPPTPPNHHRIVVLNETGRTFEGDPAELEAGANRCAVS